MLGLQRQELFELIGLMFSYLEEGALFATADGSVLFYNRAAATLEGIEPSQAIGRHIDDLFKPESAVSRALHQALAGKDCDDLILTEFDDRNRPVRIQVQCFPLRLQGRLIGVLRLTRDLALWAPELEEDRLTASEQSEGEAAMPDDGAAVLSGRSAKALALQDKVHLLRDAWGPVLLWGPPGSGRSSLAKLIHRQANVTGPLLSCDFRFRSHTAQEITLFGVDTTLGLWHQAAGGSLLLEELHLASPRLQSRLVELLAAEAAPRCFLVLPGSPEEAVQSGNLHPGLAERCIAQIELPALSERSEDLPQICQYLLRRINLRLQRRIFGLTPLAKEAIQRYPWPGGLRELAGVLESAALQAAGTVITPELLPQSLHRVIQGLAAINQPSPAFTERYDPRRFQGVPTLQEEVKLPETHIAEEPPFKEETPATQESAAPPIADEPPASSPVVLPVFPEPPVRTKRRRFGEQEKAMIVDALRLHDNDLAATAKHLRMRENTLRRRLEQYGIALDSER